MLKLLVVSTYILCTIFVSSQNVTNATMLQWLVFLGGRINYESIDHLDSLHKSLQLFYGVATEPWIAIQAATTNQEGNGIHHWSSYQMYFIEPQQMQSIIDFYENMDQVNNKLNNEEVNDNKSHITCTGNIVFCYADNDPLCTDSNNIGPTNNELTSYGPITMNTDFNLSNIVLIENWWPDKIEIFVSMAIIHSVIEQESDDLISQIMEKELFANGSVSSLSVTESIQIDDDIYFKQVTVKVTYDDLEHIYHDIGDPNNWSDKYTEFYYSPNNEQNMILYWYEMTAVCSNRDFCDQFLKIAKEKDEDDEYDESDDKTWMIVSIVFICLFVIAVIAIIAILWKYGESKFGYSRPTEIEINK